MKKRIINTPSLQERLFNLQRRIFKNLLMVICAFLSVFLILSCSENTPVDDPDLRYDILADLDPEPDPDFAFSPYIAGRYLRISEAENNLYAMDTTKLSMKEVITPEEDNFVSGNYNFGFPVAAMVNSTIIISTQRKLIPGQVDDNTNKGQFCLISDNYGKDWSERKELQELQPYGYEIGGLSCIGSFNSTFVQKAFGILSSDDYGADWLSYARAFKYISLDDWSMYGLNSPQILNHPEFGLMFFTGTTNEQSAGSVFVSNDNGETWNDDLVAYTGISQVSCSSPSAMLLNDGSILMVSGDGGNIVQYFYKYQAGDTYSDIVFEVNVLDDIVNATADFADLILNPSNGRIEMLEGSALILNLWSISVTEVLQGGSNWNKECVLLERETGIDPLHPAGSVIDETNGMQRIFIYTGGEYPDRNCIFQIIRTLDTDQLSTLINDVRGG